MESFEGIKDFKATLNFTKEENPHKLLCESSFAILFPRYREKYIRECWPHLEAKLKEYGIDCDLNLVEGSMKVATSADTWDPYIILKSRDVIKALSRSVPLPHALRCLSDDVFFSVVKIGSMVRNKTRFKKRRQRLMGSEGSTLKAIEILTNCYVAVQGNTVALVGDEVGVREAERIVTDCMNNIHPIYNIKSLMIQKELGQDEKLAGESWDRFLPKFKSKSSQPKKKKKKGKVKKAYTPFPPPQPLSKIDIQLRTGEYFMSETARSLAREDKIVQEQREKRVIREEKRAVHFEPPQEDNVLDIVQKKLPDSDALLASIKKKTKRF